MYSDKNKSTKTASWCVLKNTLLASVFVFSFANNVSAQSAWLPDRMICTLTGTNLINFGIISGFEDRVLTASSDIQPQCKSDYFTQDSNNNWIVSGSACVGVTALESPKDIEPRYLYLKGDRTSPYKLPYNYYINFANNGLEVGDGDTTPGASLSYAGAIRSATSMPTAPVDVDLRFSLIARYNFHYTNLPIGEYWNEYTINMRTGAGGSSPSSMTLCGGFPNVVNPITVRVMAKIESSCMVTTKRNINFGLHTRLTPNMTAYGELSVRCNSDANYQIGLDGGRNKNTTDRRMSLQLPNGMYDSSKTIAYDVYLPNTRSNWGNERGVDTYKGVGNNSEQTIRVDAQINPQGNQQPEVGTYSDVLVVSVYF
ncbi:spore coat U domain-containing protein [Bartonella sp. HY329]|uniref:Csu type fimbrial protein n=1 Tax=unclassified Bartonella TaxID=2645622 RepID=UPI0021C67746|nr:MULTISPECIES: spore coat U domain-containing protein [unclassified Bartonella]UXM94072.1 spore coat U domain-containing protein [Bartonella sp. HY329]UXN08394.1 spore coat U domain-containing protein [Bartonella sp. HY328]